MKAILVIDMPKDCLECSLSHNGDFYCVVTGNNCCDKGRSKGCPLKLLPKKKNSLSIDDTIKKDKFRGETIYFEKAIKLAIEKGWNACIDEILGEEE